MPRLTAGEAARLCGGEVIGDPEAEASGFGADSRHVTPGHGFVAIRSGHAHSAEALAAGASFAVVSDRAAVPQDGHAVVVPDTVRALWHLARHWRDRLDVVVVGITGSTGKTLTKDLTSAALRPRYEVHSTPGSYNNEIGLPLVLLGCTHDHDVVVCEMGARRPGDVAQLVRLARPLVGVVTGIGVTHLGVFGDRRTIARSKAELVVLPAGGHAILPAADDFLHVLASATPAKVTTVGPGGTVRIGGVSIDDRGRPSATVSVAGREVGLRLELPGRPLLRNAAMALAVAHVLGVDLDEAAAAISSAPTSAWRMEVHRAGARTIVNDAYNANPTSVEAALRTVREMAGGREAWAVLGEMAELGDASPGEHRRVGRLARDLGFTGVVAVGAGAAAVLEGSAGIGCPATDAEEAARVIGAAAAPNAVVLVKGSRVAGLERAAALLIDGIEVAG